MNSQLIRMEAMTNGYVEGIALDTNGYVSEGSGENIFLVTEGTVVTPPLSASVLPGITRRTINALCEDMGIPIKEQTIPREMLYIADEAFFAGTAVEITPLRSIDRINVGRGTRGPITKKIQDAFFATVSGNAPDKHGWLTPVAAREPTGHGRSLKRNTPRPLGFTLAPACTPDRKSSLRNSSAPSFSFLFPSVRSAPTSSSAPADLPPWASPESPSRRDSPTPS